MLSKSDKSRLFVVETYFVKYLLIGTDKLHKMLISIGLVVNFLRVHCQIYHKIGRNWSDLMCYTKHIYNAFFIDSYTGTVLTMVFHFPGPALSMQSCIFRFSESADASMVGTNSNRSGHDKI